MELVDDNNNDQKYIKTFFNGVNHYETDAFANYNRIYPTIHAGRVPSSKYNLIRERQTMLLRGYKKVIFRPEMNPGFESLRRKCNEPTCLVFATRLVEGVKSPGDCPDLSVKHRQKLEAYPGGFQFEDWLPV